MLLKTVFLPLAFVAVGLSGVPSKRDTCDSPQIKCKNPIIRKEW